MSYPVYVNVPNNNNNSHQIFTSIIYLADDNNNFNNNNINISYLTDNQNTHTYSFTCIGNLCFVLNERQRLINI